MAIAIVLGLVGFILLVIGICYISVRKNNFGIAPITIGIIFLLLFAIVYDGEMDAIRGDIAIPDTTECAV